MGLLRGPAHRERPARHPSRLGPAVQGHLPALSHHARQARRAQGRLGLSRLARRSRGRKGARLLRQARDRGLRHRAVQREVPGVGAALRRRLAVAHVADRHVARHRRRVLDDAQRVHRERVVAVPSHVGRRRDLRRLQGRAVLRPVRHRAVVARAGPAGRVPRPHRAVGLRALPRRGSRLRPARLDHDSVDAAVQHRRRGRPRHRVRAGAERRTRSRDGTRTGTRLSWATMP